MNPVDRAQRAVTPGKTPRTVRAVRADEWGRAKRLRLEALRDPAAPVAYLDTYENAVGRPDSFWRERAEQSARGTSTRHFVAETADGVWVGAVVVLVEPKGSAGVLGVPGECDQAHLVGVYVRPDHRGTGLLKELFDAATGWAWSLEEPRVERVRLHVDERNGRARAAYAKLGFEPTGVTVPVESDPSARELELTVTRPGDSPRDRA